MAHDPISQGRALGTPAATKVSRSKWITLPQQQGDTFQCPIHYVIAIGSILIHGLSRSLSFTDRGMIMRCTMLALALVVSGSSTVLAQSGFNLGSSFPTEQKSPSPTVSALPADPLLEELEKMSEPQSEVRELPTETRSEPAWAEPPSVAKPRSAGSRQLHTGADIPGVSQWAPMPVSSPRPLLAYVQCDPCGPSLWACYEQERAQWHLHAHRHAHRTCRCMTTQHFGHVCTSHQCSHGNCNGGCGGGCDSAGMASNAPVNRYQEMAQQGPASNQKAAQPTSNVAQFWPNPALASKSNPSAVTPSKTSRSNAELPVTFR